jgi:Protein of unknown function (DUF1223)
VSKDRSDVLPLAFHVTYWDRLGWRDPFSLEAATERQGRYGHRFGDGSYTPEMVIDGSVGLVGSHRDEVNAAIARAKQSQLTGRAPRRLDVPPPIFFARPNNPAASSPPTTHSASFGPTQSGAAASTLLDWGFGEQRYGSPSRHG